MHLMFSSGNLRMKGGCLCFCHVLFLGLLNVCAGFWGRLSVLSVTLCLVVIWDCLSVCVCFVFFAVIIMGCSLLLSHFLFIALILSSGSSLTSQGFLRCGNQGELYLLSVCSHLKTSDLIKVNTSIFLCQSLAVHSVFFKKVPHISVPILQ